MSEKTGQDKTDKKVPAKPADNRRGARKPAPNANTPNPETPAGEKRGGSGLAVLALLVAAAAGGAAGYLWQQQQNSQERLAAVESRVADDLAGLRSTLSGALEQRTAEVARTAREADRQFAAKLEEMQATINGVRARLGQDRIGWTVAEVEHLLRVGNIRLLLAGDFEGATAALESADQRLTALGDPAYLPVREAIAGELQALRNIGSDDHQAAAMKLAGLIRGVDALPVADPYRADQRQAPGPEAPPQVPKDVSSAKEFMQALWGDIRSLVTIRRHEDGSPASPLLAPEERYFLYQNLRLKLETARLALLDARPEVYRTALAESQQWLATYFADAQATRGAVATLAELQAVTVKPELPDISDSLRVLTRIQNRLDRERRVAAPNAAANEASPAATAETEPRP